MYLPNVLTRYQFLLGTKIGNSLKCVWYFSCCAGRALAVTVSSSIRPSVCPSIPWLPLPSRAASPVLVPLGGVCPLRSGTAGSCPQRSFTGR